ncbi:unnamed protein product [Nesidiocoris tenuis]|uniref:Uncharacterized protein n=1 Tax=Nesidiocoris tenuis TaxID=355587 RepID=A0A6H5GJB4_9HEMI|nr:unnamed protein product [Nesidiocoris tenuis]
MESTTETNVNRLGDDLTFRSAIKSDTSVASDKGELASPESPRPEKIPGHTSQAIDSEQSKPDVATNFSRASGTPETNASDGSSELNSPDVTPEKPVDNVTPQQAVEDETSQRSAPQEITQSATTPESTKIAKSREGPAKSEITVETAPIEDLDQQAKDKNPGVQDSIKKSEHPAPAVFPQPTTPETLPISCLFGSYGGDKCIFSTFSTSTLHCTAPTSDKLMINCGHFLSNRPTVLDWLREPTPDTSNQLASETITYTTSYARSRLRDRCGGGLLVYKYRYENNISIISSNGSPWPRFIGTTKLRLLNFITKDSVALTSETLGESESSSSQRFMNS